MKALVSERDQEHSTTEQNDYVVGKILNQSSDPLDTQNDMKESFCLQCKRRPAVAALMPCGHLCVCEVCLKERVGAIKTCPICKKEVTGAVNILGE